MSKKQSVALGYDQKNQSKAPKIIAKGTAELAEDIISLAHEQNLLVFEDEALTEFLGQFDLGDEIPKQLYQVIAELIGFSYVLQGKTPEHWQEDGIKRINTKS